MELFKQIVKEASYYNNTEKSDIDSPLLITKEMLRQARGNKMSMIVRMRPQDFLKLTTSSNTTREDIERQCKALDDYNKWAAEGETIIMPSLWIEGEQVKGHEGRHRASALICAGYNEMPVAIRLYPEEQHQEKYGYWEAPYKMKYEDMESAIHGQYGKGIVLRSDFKPVIDGWDNLSK